MAFVTAACQKQKTEVCVFCGGPTAPTPTPAPAPAPAPTPTPTPGGISAPGAFNITGGVCLANRTVARISYTRSANADWYEFERLNWTSGQNRGRVGGRVNGDVLTVDLPADPSATNYYQVIAGNGGSAVTRSTTPQGYREDVPGFFFTCGPPPACSNNLDDDGDRLIDAADPGCHEGNDLNRPYDPNDNDEYNPPPATTGPGPGGPGPVGPTPTCAAPTFSTSWNGSSGQISVNPSSCGGRFSSNGPNFVSVSAGGVLTGLNRGCADIFWNNDIHAATVCKS